MNVLFLTTHLNTGGITSYLLTLSKGLIQRGYSVYIASSGGNTENEFRALGVNLRTLDIHVKSELHPKLYFALPGLRRYIRDEHIDLVHAHTRVTQVMAQWLQWMTKVAFVSTCHGYFKTRLSRRLFPCWGDYVIAISEAVSNHLRDDFKIDPKKISLIESGIDLQDFSLINDATRQQSRKQFGLTDEPAIGMIARLSDVKGPDILIQAMSQIIKVFPTAKLLIVGQGKMEEALTRMIHELHLENHVKMYPIVNRPAQVLPAFDVFCVPSRQEGLGLSVMEAQAVGLPVVASNVGGIPTLIRHDETGVLVPPENPDALARAIIAVLENHAFAQSLGVKARYFIEATHSADFMVEKIEGLYQKATHCHSHESGNPQ